MKAGDRVIVRDFEPLIETAKATWRECRSEVDCHFASEEEIVDLFCRGTLIDTPEFDENNERLELGMEFMKLVDGKGPLLVVSDAMQRLFPESTKTNWFPVPEEYVELEQK